MARRATYLDTVRELDKPTLLVDAGDLFGKRNRLIKEQSRFLAEVTGSFGYDAIGLGEIDLNYGLEFFREMMAEHHLPYTNANVRLGDTGELLLPPYIVVERGGIRFGIISVLGDEQKIVTMSAREPVFEIDDPLRTLRELIPKVREEADTIIVLSHLGDRKTEAMVKDIVGIDVVVVGHTYRNFREERVVGQSIMVAAGYDGRFMGKMEMSIEEDTGKVKAFSVEMTGLDEAIAEDPDMVDRVDTFKQDLAQFKLDMRGDFKPTRGSDKEQFLTTRTCQKCHGDIWQKLRSSEHQSAFASIAKKGQGDAPECIVCHVTGYLYKNGYDEEPPYNRLTNVQCEACHGYGSEHRRDGSMLKMARKSCTECHDKENSPEFDYDTYWEKIAH